MQVDDNTKILQNTSEVKSVADKIAHFFVSPNSVFTTPHRFSTLYLIRKNIEFYIAKRNPDAIDLYHCTIAIYSALDLLSKFANASNYYFEPKRFKIYLQNYCELSDDDATSILTLRNRMVSIFEVDIKKLNSIEFSLNTTQKMLVKTTTVENEETTPTQYTYLNVNLFYHMLENSIINYEGELNKKRDLLKSFNKSYNGYGWVDIH